MLMTSLEISACPIYNATLRDGFTFLLNGDFEIGRKLRHLFSDTLADDINIHPLKQTVCFFHIVLKYTAEEMKLILSMS